MGADVPSSAWRARLDALVDEVQTRMQQVREHLHRHPELSGDEYETTRYLRSLLDETRFNIRTGPDGRGLMVDTSTASADPIIALRADLDALPIQDAKAVPYKSTKPGVMHACGHDGHAASLLGAVWALEAARDAGVFGFPFAYRAIFQPAEESNKGALEMCAAGALNGVGAIIGAHMDPSRAPGTVGVRDGVFTADCVELGIRIVGRGGHAARPHESLDPVAVAAQLITSLYLFVPRGADSHDPVVLSFGAIRGGDAPNSIPDEVVLRGTLRTMSPASRKKAIDHIKRLSEGLANASTTQIEITTIEGPPALTNDTYLSSLIAHEARQLLGEERVQQIEKPSMGGEDFANYLTHIPGAMFRVGCRGGEAPPPLHSPRFDIDPLALSVSAKLLARTACAWMEQRHSGTATT